MYKCLQVTPDRTVNNKRGSDFARAMHEYMYLPLHSRVNLSERKLDTLNAIWWIVILKRSGITFNLCVNESQETFAKQRLAHYWERASIVESELKPCQIENTSISQLKYSRHNIFALSADWREDTIPMSSILQVVKDMHDEDEARLYVGLQPYSRTAWSDWATAAHESFKTGRTPQRRSAQSYTGWRQGVRLLDGVMTEISSAVDVLFSTKTEAKMADAKRRQKPDYDKKEIMMDGRLSRETLAKRNEPVFRTFIYATSHSLDSARRQITLSGLCNAFTELAVDNELVQVKLSTSHVHTVNNLKIPHSFDACLMSCSEVGKLVQLPTASLQDEYSECIQTRRQTEFAIPKCFKDKRGIYVGDIVHNKQKSSIYLPTNDDDMLFTPRAFVASPRSGKDMAIVNFVVECKKHHNIGTVILDAIDERGQRGMSDSVRDALDANDLIDLNLGDFDHPIYLGLHDIANSSNESIVRNRIAQELTNFLMGDDTDTARTEDYLFAFAQASNGDPLMIKTLLTDANARGAVIKTSRNSDAIDSIQQYSSLSEKMQSVISTPILTRLGKIQRDAFLKPLFCQQYNPNVSFKKWMSENKVIIVRIPSRDLGPSAVKTIMHWLTLVVFLTKVSGCGGKSFVIFNEAHQYETPGWVSFVQRMLYEGSKYRISPIFAFYDFKKLSREFIDVLMSSGVNWHLGNNSSIDVFTRLKDVLDESFTPEQAKALVKRFEFIAAWRDVSGEYQTPFLYHAPDLVHERYKTSNNDELTKLHSEVYGRPLKSVLHDIRTRSMMNLKK